MSLADCHPDFQTKVRNLADLAGLDADAVYSMWRRYANDCFLFDQSAVWSEFLLWYEKDLGVTQHTALQFTGQ